MPRIELASRTVSEANGPHPDVAIITADGRNTAPGSTDAHARAPARVVVAPREQAPTPL